MEQYTAKMLRQRKFFTVVPVFVLPFLTLFFWVLGGGKGYADGTHVKKTEGFNMDLPGANVKDGKGLDKLSYYEMADKDSAKLKDLIKNDPYYRHGMDTSGLLHAGGFSNQGDDHHTSGLPSFTGNPITNPIRNATDSNEAKVYRKLGQLNAALDAPEKYQAPEQHAYKKDEYDSNPSAPTDDVDRLEAMMKTMQQGTGDNPEMTQLNGMIDKLLELQHPELASERVRKLSQAHRKEVFPMSATAQKPSVTLLERKHSFLRDSLYAADRREGSGFYGLGDNENAATQQTSIEAVVHQTQTLVGGATVKLRLLGDAYVNGILVPKGTFVYGVVSLSAERLIIAINTIRIGGNILPVSLTAYDLDGVAGVYIPGAITRDVAKQSADQSLQNIGAGAFSTSLGAQAASAGIETARTLISRKVKLVKVTVKAGYHVLLVDDNAKNEQFSSEPLN